MSGNIINSLWGKLTDSKVLYDNEMNDRDLIIWRRSWRDRAFYWLKLILNLTFIIYLLYGTYSNHLNQSVIFKHNKY